MLEELRIAGLGVIEDAHLELAAGLTVVTGETGAGKTMVVTGLALLRGARADGGLVRAGGGRALVEGVFRIEPGSRAATRALEAGAEVDADPGAVGVGLVAARTLSAEGRSRAHLGGRTVPVALLAELAEELVAVHGQSDQLRFLRPGRQRAALDAYSGDPVGGPLTDYRERYARLRALEAELEALTSAARERAREADLLRFGLDEVAAVDPAADELDQLLAEESRLAHAEALRDGAGLARDALAGSDEPAAASSDALTRLAVARRALEPVGAHDPALAALAGRLAESAYQLADVAADLSAYAGGIEVDPARLASVQERRAALTGLTRKYGDTLADVLAWARDAAARLDELDTDDDRVQALRTERSALRGELGRLAGAVSTARSTAGEALAAAVTAELAELAMPAARVAVQVTRSADPDGLVVPAPGAEGSDGAVGAGPAPVAYGRDGVDEVELLLAPHAGSELRPLARGASGGELSRVMLAVEVVLAGAQPGPLLVFDEVDAGVGGRAAVEVGRRLAALARSAQVLVVTHLPQVAAFADTHLRVVKGSADAVTSSGVTRLDDAGRVRELSRMLAGLEGSATAEAHAEELLAAAAEARATTSHPSHA